MESNVLVTIKANSQLDRVAMLLAGPRARSGNISDITSQGTGPQANAKKKLNKTIHKIDNQEILDSSTEWLIEPTKDTASLDELLSDGFL